MVIVSFMSFDLHVSQVQKVDSFACPPYNGAYLYTLLSHLLCSFMLKISQQHVQFAQSSSTTL